MQTRLTKRYGLTLPILSAPMALVSGGALAASVSNAGGLGLIGGAYGDADWTMQAFEDAGAARVGCGFITWKLAQNPELLEPVLAEKPAALLLSFGDPASFAAQIAAANVPMICQVQTLRDAKHAADLGADMIVAQGAEAGGHGEARATMTLVPEVADWLAANAPEVLLLAAGGIADGRGLAASLMLGADGVLVGSKLWASDESLAHPNMIEAGVLATGDETIRSNVMDVARGLNWPERYTARVLQNAFTDQWHGNLEALLARSEAEAARWSTAWDAGDTTIANTFVGEAAGLIHSRGPAGEMIIEMVDEAEAVMRGSVANLEA